jgi:hypothetical protein
MELLRVFFIRRDDISCCGYGLSNVTCAYYYTPYTGELLPMCPIKKRVLAAFIAAGLIAGAKAGNLNEWTFEADTAGLTLSNAVNVGSEGAVFSSDGLGIKTDGHGGLLCTNDVAGTSGMWTNGALLNADTVNTSTGTNYLRFDVDYNFSSTSNDSGTVTGLFFTDNAGTRSAGLALIGSYGTPVPPSGTTLSGVKTNLSTTIGKLSVIAKVDIGNQKLSVWYDVTGANIFNEAAPAVANLAISLTSIGSLQFQATGDFRPAGTADFVNYDNVRHATTWKDIAAPLADYSAGQQVEIVSITVTNASGTTGTNIGETNTVTVLINNLGAPATNVTATLIPPSGKASWFNVTSNNSPVTLTYPSVRTNTFLLTANTNTVPGTYTFSINVTANGGISITDTFDFTVGSLVTYQSNSVSLVSGGLLPGVTEPGEVINLTVFSINNGANDLTDVTNSISLDSSNFTVLSNATPAVYAFLPVGKATSTTWTVRIDPTTPHGTNWFSITNRDGTQSWSGSDSLGVYSRAIPAVSPPAIAISVVVGLVVTNTQVTVTNSGNATLTFSISDDGTWDPLYSSVTGHLDNNGFVSAYQILPLNDPKTNSIYIEAETEGVSSMQNIGFRFPFYGTTYSNFYVTADGYIGLSNTTNLPSQSVDRKTLPSAGMDPLIAPLWGRLRSPAGSIHYIRQSDYLVISYSNVSTVASFGGTDLDFQAALYTDGRIEFRYKKIIGSLSNLVTVGLQGSAGSYTNLVVTPVSGMTAMLTPQQDQWVRYPTQSIPVEPQSSQTVSFIADASGKTAGTGTSFSAWFNWSTGGSNAVSVSANVTAAAPVYSAVSSLSFTGAAGQVTSVPFVISNTTGTGMLIFTISNSAALASGFITTNPAYDWIDISATGTNVSLIDPSPNPYITAADEGFSAMIPVGFAFPFYGGSYSQLCVGVNGALRLDTTGRVNALHNLASTNSLMPVQMIAPYWGDLAVDTNATIKYRSTTNQLVITWENIRQYGLGGGSNLTFQVILNPFGDITFQYKKLEGLQWANTTIGLRDTTNRTKQTDLRQTGDRIITTNLYGSVSTQSVNAVSNRAVRFQFAQVQVIRYTPPGGSIPAGSNAVVTITGDASNQQTGTNNLSTNTMLTITHNAAGSPASLAVNFTVTNSQEPIFVHAAASALADGNIDSDGDGISDEQERIAGTDPQNADSVFAPTIGRDPSGAFLSWPSPLDGVQRNYTIYFSTNLMSLWEFLCTVTNGTTYLDATHSSAPVIYYKITVPMQ